MTKYLFSFLSFLLLASCAAVSYARLPTLIKDSIFGYPKIIVDSNIYESKQFSFINVRLNEKSSALMTLYSVNQDHHKWIGSNNEKIITDAMTGKIIKTLDLPNDITVLSGDIIIADNYSGSISKIFRNPDAFITEDVNVTYLGRQDIMYLDEELLVDVYKEDIFWKQLNAERTNLYYFKDNRIISTKQNIHLRNGYFVIDFYYK